MVVYGNSPTKRYMMEKIFLYLAIYIRYQVFIGEAFIDSGVTVVLIPFSTVVISYQVFIGKTFIDSGVTVVLIPFPTIVHESLWISDLAELCRVSSRIFRLSAGGDILGTPSKFPDKKPPGLNPPG